MRGKILFIAATHGDEGFSIDVLKRIERKYPKSAYGYDWIVGNPKAYKKNCRFVDQDLNRSAPGDENSSIYEEIRAARVIKLAEQYSVIVDIHGTIADTGIVSIIPYPSLRNIFLASMIPVRRNVIWSSKRSVVQGPFVQFMKGPGIELECGPKNDPRIKKRLEKTLVKIINSYKNDSVIQSLTNIQNKLFYQVYGKEENMINGLKEFKKVIKKTEEYYPFLVNEYKKFTCYKLKKIIFEDLFTY